MRFGLLATAAVLLAGCAGPNTDIRNVQFSGAENSLPVDYLGRAARAVDGLPTAPGVEVTFLPPRTVVGVTAFSPKRWYVCAEGLASPGPKPSGTKPISHFTDEWLFGARPQGRYDVIVFFNESGLTSLLKGYDAQLCDV